MRRIAGDGAQGAPARVWGGAPRKKDSARAAGDVGLAAYAADGVQTVLELLQNDLARNMGALGAPNLAKLTREMIRIHRR